MTTVDKHAPGTIAWFDVMTPDPEAARAFYHRLFGWTYEIRPDESEPYTMCQLDGRNAAGIATLPPGAPFPSSWSIYFAVDDAERAVARVRQHRGQVLMGPIAVQDEGRLAFCLDPTGASFGLWQSGRHIGAAVVDEPGAMTWSEVNTRDATSARAFYEHVFDLEARKRDAPADYWALYRGDQIVSGVLQMNAAAPTDIPPQWMPYFAVRDTDAAVARIVELGGAQQQPPFDSSHGRIAVVADPWGATFRIVQPTAHS